MIKTSSLLAGAALADAPPCRQCRQSYRRRRHLPAPGLCQVGRGLQSQDRQRAELPGHRIRRRHQADQGARPSISAPPTIRCPATNSTSRALIQFPAVIGGVVPVVNIEGVAPGQDGPGRQRHRRNLQRQGQEVERSGHRQAQRRTASCRTRRSRRSIAPTPPARPRSSPATWPKSRRSSSPTSAPARRSTGRSVSAARATPAWPPT